MFKMERIGWLYDFYGPLLTQRQRELVELHYHHDLSLGEIADQYAISRPAVYDTLKRTERLLEDYEVRLGLLSRFNHRRLYLERLDALLNDAASESREWLREAQEIVRTMLRAESPEEG